MIKLVLCLVMMVGYVHGQTAGVVTYTPPSPGKIVVTANTVSCTITGNNAPATGVMVNCNLGSTIIPGYLIPLPANTSYVFDHRLNNDAVTITLASDAAGKITWQAAATPNGGVTTSNSGIL
jgi:hypothetical protein